MGRGCFCHKKPIKVRERVLKVNRKQVDLLSGFFVHLWCVKFEGVKMDVRFWARELDRAKIPWNIQNKIAELAGVRNNKFLYFSTVLKNAGIEVT